MKIVDTVEGLRNAADRIRASGERVGLVPTMGALHEGHLSLVRRALQFSDRVVVTIFVNPTQFGPQEDFERYPRNLERDCALAESAGTDIVFAPPVAEMYPKGERTRVRVSGLTERLCGASRPGHFEGVTTIVTKLFNSVGPCAAVFGRKDYQQLQVIRRMTKDLLLPVEVIGAPIVREADGLALSSRNRYLSEAERECALAIPRSLARAATEFEAGHHEGIVERVTKSLDAAGLELDYVTLADPDALTELQQVPLPPRALLAVAAFAGQTRLIDNVVLGEDEPPRVEEFGGGAT